MACAVSADRARCRLPGTTGGPDPAGQDFRLPDLQLRHVARAALLRSMTPAGLGSQLLQLGLAIALAPLLVGWVNQCRAWLQNRRAPSLFLPYRTIRKLFTKEAIVAAGASPIFRLAP